MNTLSSLLCLFVERNCQKHKNHQVDFIKAIESNLILFGYQDNAYFERHYAEQEEFLAAME